MHSRSTFLLATAPALLAIAAHAADMDTFTIRPATGGDIITFQLAASPVVAVYSSGDFAIKDVTTTIGLSNILLFSAYDFGGLEVATPHNVPVINAYGAQLFAGINTAPTFLLGTFTLTDPFSGSPVDTVTIAPLASAVVTPEPSSLFLLGTGVVALLGATHRRDVKRAEIPLCAS